MSHTNWLFYVVVFFIHASQLAVLWLVSVVVRLMWFDARYVGKKRCVIFNLESISQIHT